MVKVFNFKNINFNKGKLPPSKTLNIDWSRTGDKLASSMHSISSYLAMFTPAMPKYFIEKYTEKGDLIFDPFSGRGTTALKARKMNRRFIGSDLNPYALVLSRTKIGKTSKNKIFKKINYIENQFNNWIKKDNNKNVYKLIQYEELRYFYSPMVLNQLIFLRETYGKKWKKFSDIKNIIFGIILGLMHGQSKKDGTSIYFSLDMPNTISMAPNYVKNYAIKNSLKKPNVNIFNLIRNRTTKKFDDILNTNYKSKIYEKNALHKNRYIKKESIKLLITSPPYLNIVNYTRSNWLKLWLLGFDRKDLHKIKLSDKLKFDSYIKFISKFLNNVYPKIKIGGYTAIVIGDVHDKNLLEEIWEKIENKTKFKLLSIFKDISYTQNKKTTNMLNNKKGKATIIEKVLLLKK